MPSSREEARGSGEMGEGLVNDQGGSSARENACGTSARKRGRRDPVVCGEETSSVRRRITRSYSAKQREELEAASRLKEVSAECLQIKANVAIISSPCVVEGSVKKTGAAEEASLGAEQHGDSFINSARNSAEGITSEEIKVDEPRMPGFDVAEQQVQADAHRDGRAVGQDAAVSVKEAACGAKQNGESLINSVKDSLEEMKVDDKGIMGSDAAGKEVEFSTYEEKATKASVLGAELITKSPETSSGNAVMEEVTCAVKIDSEPENMPLLSVAEKREEADSDNREGMGVVLSGSDHNKDCFSVDKRKTRKQRKGLKLAIEGRRVLRSDAAKKREETDKKEMQLLQEAAAGADQDRNSLKSSHRNDPELIKGKEEIDFERELAMRSDLDKEREESIINIAVKSGPGRKRKRAASDTNITRKKTKMDSSKIGAKKMKMDSMEHRDERTEIIAHQSSEPVVLTTGENDFPVEKTLESKLQKASKMKAVKIKKDCSSSIVSKRKKFGRTECKNITEPGKRKSNSVSGTGDTFSVSPSNRKGGQLERAHVKREKEQIKKNLKPSTIAKRNMLKRFFLLAECEVPENSSSRSVGESTSQVGSRAGKKKSSKSKQESDYLPPQIKAENVAFSNKKAQIIVKDERSCTPNLPLNLKQKVKEEKEDRSTSRQKLREQIKSMLLSYGWKIDLRPRNGRNYKDSVYISPEGSGYWSITKAYNVFERQLKRARDESDNNTPKTSSKTCTGSSGNLEGTSSFSPIPMNVLKILKKTVVYKKRSKRELEEAKREKQNGKKLDAGSRHKKTKGNAKVKFSKNKHVEVKGADLSSKIKKKHNVDSSKKSRSGHLAEKSQLLPGRKKYKQRGCALLVRGANQETEADTGIYVPYVWKRTIMSWMIDLGVVSANGKVKYMNKRRTRAMLEGMITRDGILCSCCNEILTIVNFESHAGSRLCQPYQNIFVEEAGTSLHRCQLNAWEKQEESERRGFYSIDVDGDDPNDDTCGICGDGGDLICCDACPSTFHLSCLDIQMLPPGNWHCTYCLCKFCGMVVDNSVQESGKASPQLFSCYQCEDKYHQRCVPEADAISTDSENSCVSFCGDSCRKVFERLRSLLGVKNDMEEGFSWSIVQRIDENTPKSLYDLDQKAECNSKIAVALGVMDECFLPIIDQRSGINLIHNVVYNCGSNFNRLDYRGFYTFILEKGDEIISAASLRIHGTRLAEMPFIGTRNMYRRQGMCRRLLDGIESVLRSLSVEKFIIPAISELIETWTTVFGFQPLDISQKQDVRLMNVLVFPGTGLLLKPLLRTTSAELCKVASGVGIDEQDNEFHSTSLLAHESPLLSSLEPNHHISDEVNVQRKDKMKDVGSSSSSSGGSIHSTAEVFSESFETAHGSECQSPDNESMKNSDMKALHHEDVSHNDSILKNNFPIDSSMNHEIKVPIKISVPDGHESNNGNYDVGKSLHSSVETLVQHTSHVKCTFTDTISTILENRDVNSKPAHGASSPKKFQMHCMVPKANSSTEQDPCEHVSTMLI